MAGVAFRNRVRRALAWVVAPVLLGSGLVVVAAPAPAHAVDTTIATENAKPGTDQSVWDITGAGDLTLQGYATQLSVLPGDTVNFKIDDSTVTDSAAPVDYNIPIYRLGYYGGKGARAVGTVLSTNVVQHVQPACSMTDPGGANLVDCGNWSVSAQWTVPSDAVSGVYIARPTRISDGTKASHIVFVVRNDSRKTDILVQTSDTTWQAYNPYGGYNLYTGLDGSLDSNAWKVSYNRPFTTRLVDGGENWLFNSEYPMIRWLESNGYDVSYTTHGDVGRNPGSLTGHKVFMSSGHDEYWSQAERTAVEGARDAGVNIAFFSGNDVYWRTRYEDSPSDAAGNQKTMVVYKEGSLAPSQEGEHRRCYLNWNCDPTSSEWTGLWRELPNATKDGPAIGSPENALTGQISWRNNTSDLTVPSDYAGLRFWAHTSVASLAPGQSVTLGSGTLGYEWSPQYEQYMAYYPAGRVLLSSTTAVSTFAGADVHHLSLYRASSGALVFGAGTVQWAWGLDGTHDRTNTQSSSAPVPAIQQATVNLLADMGAQPGTLQAGLVAASQSTDVVAPTVAITSPADSASVPAGPVTVTGTASDVGGAVGVVEVSTDGAVWHPATGRDTWSYTFTAAPGSTTISVRAADDSANLGAVVTRTISVTPRVCDQAAPCSIFAADPVNLQDPDTSATELGVKFRSSTDGYVTGVRFYKTAQNTGTHTGSLWAADGTNLASAVFTSETATGWQDVTFTAPVHITAGTTYVASYHAPSGHYALGTGLIYDSVVTPPLTALQTGIAGDNGVYAKGGSPTFPAESAGPSNYLVDVLFSTTVGPDTTAPEVVSTTPVNSAAAVPSSVHPTATFSEAMAAASITTSSVVLTDASSAVVPASVSYDAATRTVTLVPSAALADHTTYTVRIVGGAGGVTDLVPNPLSADVTWSFTTAYTEAPRPDPNAGPGGPVLVATGNGTYDSYLKEILRSEGLNLFSAGTTDALTASGLAPYTTVVLGQTTLTAAQVNALSTWVNAGGHLVAIRPDAQLAGLLGLSAPSGTLSEAYLKVDTSTAPGEGIVADSMQFHGTADLYSALPGTQVVAELYSTSSTATGHPAVTVRAYGSGTAAAFAYDLAGSVVLTRQGNPAWINQNRDGQPGPTRTDNLYYGNAATDPQPDYVDRTKIAIPQADEQQRLLVNVLTETTRDVMPLPRFWYLPSGAVAAIVMTADNHDTGSAASAAARMDAEIAASTPGCSVADWECIRSTTYLYPSNSLTNAQAKAYEDQGFEIALHTDTGCASPTAAQYTTELSGQLADLATNFPSLQPSRTIRNHCVSWSDYTTMPEVQAASGIRMDTDYYYWPDSWVANTPGLFTGSGFAQRFSTSDGQLVDVYQATTQMSDEAGQSYPSTATALMDAALTKGYYGTFVANIHSDGASETIAAQIVAAAKARGIPVISAKQLLTWTDGRNASSFQNLSMSGNTLSFTIDAASGTNGLQAMLPVQGHGGALQTLTLDGNPVTTQNRTVKGVEYAVFPAGVGTYAATYGADTTGPVISDVQATLNPNATATVTWTTDEPSTSQVDFGTAPDQLTSQQLDSTLSMSHSVTIPLVSGTVHYRVTSADAYGNSTTSPAAPAAPLSITRPLPTATDDVVGDFTAGTTGSGTYVSDTTGGEVILAPTVGAEFDGTSLPTGWTSTQTNGTSGSSTVSGGKVTVDGSLLRTDASYASGRSLEFVATFTGTANEHIGYAVDFTVPRWAIFSTGTGGNLYARVNNDGIGSQVALGSGYFGSPHLYRIDWLADSVVFSIDGVVVSTQGATFTGEMAPAIGELDAGGSSLAVDWMRMTPYASTGTFLSRIHDAGSIVDWSTMSWTGDLPTGTTRTLSVRTGNTPTPDGTWTAFTPILNGASVGTQGRYLQYQADLATTDPGLTPVLASVTLAYDGTVDHTPPTITGRTPAPGSTDVALGSVVTVGFDEAVEPTSVTASTVRLYATGSSTDVPASLSVSGSSVTLTPTAPLAYGTSYTVSVSTGVTDLAGNGLAAADTWTFTTLYGTFTSTPVPTIAGTPVVGSMLTASLPAWTPATDSVSWQWYADGTQIPGATVSTLSLTSATLGSAITVAATGHAAGYTDVTRVSAATGPVVLPSVIAGSVSITGTPVVGTQLTATPSGWSPSGLTYDYVWRRDSTTTLGTGPTYTPVPADAGHVVSVSVTGSTSGYLSATAVAQVDVTAAPPAPGSFTAVSPTRAVDTRITGGPIAAGATRSVQVTGIGGVPASGVSAVVLNVTVTETTSGGYLTVYPTGTSRPLASNLNWSAGGTTVPNAVTVKVGTGGTVELYQSGPGTAQAIVDVEGWFVDGTVADPGGFTALSPSRVLDTRTSGGAIAAGGSRDLTLAGAGGVPASGVAAVVLNVTVTATTRGGYLTVYPTGAARPTASNLNWSTPGTTVPNLVTVKLGAGGSVTIYQSGPGTAQVIVDVAGYYLDGTVTKPGMFVPLDPTRVLDTRTGSAVPGGGDTSLAILGHGGVPATGVFAVVLNTTVTETTAGGFLTVYPGTGTLPTASNLNWSAAGTTVPNLVTVMAGSDGTVVFHNGSPGTTQVIADTAGYYLGE